MERQLQWTAIEGTPAAVRDHLMLVDGHQDYEVCKLGSMVIGMWAEQEMVCDAETIIDLFDHRHHVVAEPVMFTVIKDREVLSHPMAQDQFKLD